jgi:adenosylhomocysteine nucleosidase
VFLRWVVNSYLRQTVQRTLQNVAREAMQGRPPGPVESAGPEASGPPEGGPVEPAPPCAAALVFASDVEAGGFIDTLGSVRATRGASYVDFDGCRNGRRIVVVETGIGAAAAGRATEDAITVLRPAWVVSAGFAGSLVDHVRPGQFVLADSLVDEQGVELALGMKLLEAGASPGVHVGRLLTVEHVVRDEARRRELGARHQALACDQESMAVAQACRRQQVRCLSVRVVSDAVDQQLSRELELLLDNPSWAGKLGVAAAALLNRPSAVKEFWKLRETALGFSDRLAKFLGGVVDQLP